MPQSFNLTGKLLVAMPGMPDPRFAQSVVLLCAHSEEGAMGVMINRPSDKVSLSGLFSHLSIQGSAQAQRGVVYSGGPVEEERGFVIHSADYNAAVATLDVTDAVAMTATVDILRDIAMGDGPDLQLIALGYCGWGPGQLEAEIAENGWLIAEGRSELIFSSDDDRKWQSAMLQQGIDPLTLSSTYGRA